MILKEGSDGVLVRGKGPGLEFDGGELHQGACQRCTVWGGVVGTGAGSAAVFGCVERAFGGEWRC